MGSLMTASTANAPCFAKVFLAFYIFNLQIGQQSGVRKTVVKKATGGTVGIEITYQGRFLFRGK